MPPPEGTDFEIPTQVAKTPETSNRKSNVGSGYASLISDWSPVAGRSSEAMILTPIFIGTQVALGLFSGLFIVRRKQLLLAGDADLRRRIAGGKAASKWRQEADLLLQMEMQHSFLMPPCVQYKRVWESQYRL